MKTFRRLALVLGMVAMSQSALAAQFKLVGTGLLPSFSVTAPYADDSKGKLGIGGGALIDFMMGSKAAIEIGGLYLGRTVTSGGIDVTGHTLRIPALIRFGLMNHVSLALGGFYDMALGDLS